MTGSFCADPIRPSASQGLIWIWAKTIWSSRRPTTQKIRAAPSGAEGRHSLKGCLYVHVCACCYVCAILIGTCMCYAYWYTCVLCLLVRMCAMLIGTHECYVLICTHVCYACVLCLLAHMCAMLFDTHVCYACWHACVVWLLVRMCAVLIVTQIITLFGRLLGSMIVVLIGMLIGTLIGMVF